ATGSTGSTGATGSTRGAAVGAVVEGSVAIVAGGGDAGLRTMVDDADVTDRVNDAPLLQPAAIINKPKKRAHVRPVIACFCSSPSVARHDSGRGQRTLERRFGHGAVAESRSPPDGCYTRRPIPLRAVARRAVSRLIRPQSGDRPESGPFADWKRFG